MELSKETQQRIWAITDVVTSQYETGENHHGSKTRKRIS